MTTKGLLRSQVVSVASPGAYSGKANRWLQDHPSVTLCPLTSTLFEAPLVRLIVQPTPGNGLHKPSQLMIDKLFTVPMAAIGEVIGVLEPAAMANLNLALRGWLELG